MEQSLPEIVLVDKKRLKQVLFNLIGNALKFTMQGSVTLNVSKRGDLTTFEVRDTGIGISAEDIDKLFKFFG